MSRFSKAVSLFISVPFAVGLVVGVAGTSLAASRLLGSSVFADVPAGSYYDAAVGNMYGHDIIKGYPDGTFKPGNFVTRAELAVMLDRMMTGTFNVQPSEADEPDDDNDDSSESSSSRSRSSSTSSSSSTTSSSSSSSSSLNPYGTLRFTTAALTIIENTSLGGINVAIVRTGGNQGSVAVTLALSGSTALPGQDYVDATTTVNFTSGETSKIVKVSINDDQLAEGSEKLYLVLKDATGGASIGVPAIATLTINDNEAPNSSSSSSSASSNGPGKLSYSALAYSVAENGGTLTVNVVRTDGSTGAVGVNYGTANGTGKSGTDFQGTSGTLSFAAGETSKSFTITILNNSLIDGNRTFNVTLATPTGGATIGTASIPVTIVDEETVTYGTGSLKFSKLSYTVSEGSGHAELIVNRVGGAKYDIAVNYATVNGSATPGSDYTHSSGTLSFLAGESSKVLRIPLIDDDQNDSDENFFVNLSAPTKGATLGDPASATVLIQE